MTAAAARTSLLRQMRMAWTQAGVTASVGSEEGRRVRAMIGPGQTATRQEMEQALEVAVRALQAEGCRTCWERRPGVWSLFAFSDCGSLCVELRDGRKSTPSRWHTWNGKATPTVALLGPDGVGKSTALRLVREWFEHEAPFVDIAVRQWRPALLPSLASVAGKPEMQSGGDTKPRRTPGKGHWVRLAYYYSDFLLGSWWKDRNRGEGSRLIVYDRCALDMWVDPVRFALRSTNGTWMLWNLTPRPEKLVLLYDTADRIARRKDDLQQHEVADQLESWLKLAAGDEVHAIIRVNDGPEEIARRIRDLFIETFVDHHDHVLPAPASQVPHALSNGSSKSSAASNYAAVPSASNPRFLVPLASRAAAASSLAVYNAQRPVARVAKGLLGFGLRSGLAQRFLPQRADLAIEPLREYFGHLVGHTDLAIAVSLGTPGPNQKPALQVMNRQGRILAYAKLGCNERTTTSVRNEAAALMRLEASSFSTAVIPRVLDAGWVDGNYLLVQAPASASRLKKVNGVDERHVKFLAELHRLNPTTGALPCPPESAVARMQQAGLYYYAHLVDRVRSEYSWYESIPLGPGHGDFTPWNIRNNNGQLLVFDWETFAEDVPAGWDLFHIFIAGGVEIRNESPGTLFAALMKPGAVRDTVQEYFLAIGVEEHLIEPLLISYAANALASSILDLGWNAGEKDVAMQRTWAAILTLACNPGSATVENCAHHQQVSQAV